MTKEEFKETYQRARSRYIEAMDLMEKDSPFMTNLDEEIKKLTAKIKGLLTDIGQSKTGSDLLDKVRILQNAVEGLVELYKEMESLGNETKSEWTRLRELQQFYSTLSNLGENIPKTKEASAEWVTQLEETATSILHIYKPLSKRVDVIRKKFNILMQTVQPYLN